MQISNLPASNSFSSTDVLPIEINGVTYKVTGATLAAALQTLGNYLTTENVANNLTTTAAGSVLDARQGKTLNDSIAQQAASIGIVENGSTCTHTGGVAAGQYVIWQGVLYIADAAISVGETLAASGGSKNLTACSDGGLNVLSNKIIKISGFTTPNTATGVMTGGNIPSGYNVLQVTVHTSMQDRNINFAHGEDNILYALDLPSNNYYNKDATVYAIKL